MAAPTTRRNPMTGFSIELVPRNAASINDFREYLDEGTAVTIAWPPQLDLKDMLTAACKLRREGMEPVPHLVAGESTASRRSRNCWPPLRVRRE